MNPVLDLVTHREIESTSTRQVTTVTSRRTIYHVINSGRIVQEMRRADLQRHRGTDPAILSQNVARLILAASLPNIRDVGGMLEPQDLLGRLSHELRQRTTFDPAAFLVHPTSEDLLQGQPVRVVTSDSIPKDCVLAVPESEQLGYLFLGEGWHSIGILDQVVGLRLSQTRYDRLMGRTWHHPDFDDFDD